MMRLQLNARNLDCQHLKGIYFSNIYGMDDYMKTTSLNRRHWLIKYLSDVCKDILKSWKSYLLLSPYAVLFFTFVLLPVIISIYYSFTYYNIIQPAQFKGATNYINLFLVDEIFPIALKNTLIIALVSGPLGYLASLIFAWLINELRPLMRGIMVLIFYAPSISGAAYVIWAVLFSGDAYGYMNGFLMKLNFINEPIQWLTDPKYMMTVVIIVVIWMSLGAGFLAFVAGFQTIDKSLYEAGMVDGIRNRWQELWYITLPSIKPQLMFGAVMSITAAFAVSDVTVQLCGLPSTEYAAHTVVNHLQDYGYVRFEMGYASAIATILFAIMIFTNKFVQWLLKFVGR